MAEIILNIATGNWFENGKLEFGKEECITYEDQEELSAKLDLLDSNDYKNAYVGNLSLGDWLAENLKDIPEARYWIETEYLYGDYSTKKWALHKVDEEENDTIILWKSYDDTPGTEDIDEEDIDSWWKALEDYIESEIGFLPDYEVN